MKNVNCDYPEHNWDDEHIEASSFEEARAIILTRLAFLRADINYRTSAEEALFNELCKAHEDKKHKLLDFYARFYSPCRVINPEFNPGGEVDMNDLMINFSEGYDKFIMSMEKEYYDLTKRRRRATILLSKLLSLSYPYSRLMYLTYYMNIDMQTIIESLFISRATYYRLKAKAVNALTAIYYSGNGGPVKKS